MPCKVFRRLFPDAVLEVGFVEQIVRDASPVENILFAEKTVAPDHRKELISISSGQGRSLLDGFS